MDQIWDLVGWGHRGDDYVRGFHLALDHLGSAGLSLAYDSDECGVSVRMFCALTQVPGDASAVDMVRIAQDDLKALKDNHAVSEYEASLEQKKADLSDILLDGPRDDLLDLLEPVTSDNVLAELSEEMRAKIKAMDTAQRRETIVGAYGPEGIELINVTDYTDEDVAVALKAGDTYAKGVGAAAAAADL